MNKLLWKNGFYKLLYGLIETFTRTAELTANGLISLLGNAVNQKMGTKGK